ncbi:pyruvate kinase-like protein [Biscogniauxia marginata]|nr:pyruvate kinase-like protein [Biscogniauxia marginata]
MGSYVFGSDSDLAPLPPKDILLSLRTGKIRPLAGVKITSAINKQPHEGRVRLTVAGFEGDERDYPPHRSPDNAIHQYDPKHYASWKKTLPDREQKFNVGAFGENISTRHLSESNVCVGDKFRLGPDVIIQVTMTRQPCYKLNHRFEYKKMSSLAQKTGRTGWYYRVLQEGYVQAGDEMELIERINPRWPLSRLQHVLYKDMNNMEAVAEARELPGLSAEFIELFQKRLVAGREDMTGRLQGDVAVPWNSYKLVEKGPVTPRIQRFVFVAEDDDISPKDLQFGRFPHVRLRFGPESKFTRAYSVVSGDMRSFELGIARDDNSRGGSVYLHDCFKVGDSLQVAKGHSSSSGQEAIHSPGAKRHIFIIGGIGVTAFLNDIKALAETSAQFEVHYAVRSRQEAAYLDRLPPQTKIYAKAEGQRLRAADIVPAPVDSNDPEAMLYCSGPAPLLDECGRLATDRGYPRSHVHLEEFGGGAAAGTGDPFEAEVQPAGRVLRVPRHKSLLQVLGEAGFDVDSSCLAGSCGACMVEVRAGRVLHRGVAIDDGLKEGNMLACVSRGVGRIVVRC